MTINGCKAYYDVANCHADCKDLKLGCQCKHYALKEHDRQVRANAIDACIAAIREKENEPNYQHDGEDWLVGLCFAEEICLNMKE